ncbi:MAG TPA: hypothetical protein VK524_16635 [Polyangiaceae bacterium]|nr:hypothetical protein [Polyangiaceae bacterium]
MLLGNVGCGGRPPPVAPQSTAAAPSAPSVTHEQPALPPAAWLSLSNLSRLPAASDTPYVARGHLNGGYTAVVRVSEAALSAYRSLGPERDLPGGTLVAQFLMDAGGGTGPVFVMRKGAEKDWQFAVLRPDGGVLDSGALPLCQRCHGEASRGYLFGLPRD